MPDAYICGRLWRTKITRKASDVAEYIELFGSFTQDRHARRRIIGGRSENNNKCVVHDDLGWKNRTTQYILPRHWLYE